MSQLPNGLRRAFGDLVNTYLREPAEENAAAQQVLQLAVEHLECDAASISMWKGDGRPLVTFACTDPVVECAERLQDALGEGPILDSLRNQADLAVSDLSAERRWPNWAKAAMKLGLHRVVTVRLADWSDGNNLLNLYGSSPRRVTRDEFDIARHFAREATLAIQVSHEIWHLNRAIANRTVIGQAEGLMMERFQIDPDRAFAVLKRISSQTNRKLHVIAADVVNTGNLPSAVELRADAKHFRQEERAVDTEQDPVADVP